MKDASASYGRAMERRVADLERQVEVLRSEKEKAQKALRESRHRSRKLLETTPDLMFVLSSEGRILDYQANTTTDLAAEKGRVIGSLLSESMPPEVVDKALAAVAAALEHDRLEIIEYQLPLKGVPEDFEARITPLTGDSVLAVVRNVTRQKRSERYLRRSERKYRKLYEQAPIGIFRSTIKGRMLSANPAMTRMLGFETPEEAAAFYTDLGAQLYTDPAVRQAFIRRLQDEGHVENFEYQARTRQGKTVWLNMNARLVASTRDGEGAIEGFTADITERKQAAREQEELQTQLAHAVEIASLGHWEYDVGQDLFRFNDQFYRIFGTNARETGGYTMSSGEYVRRFVHPDDRPLVRAEIRKAISTTDPQFRRQLEHRMLRADGSFGHISVRFFAKKDAAGKTVKTYGVNQDITERKTIEARLLQAQKMESIGNLAGGIAHDFNNILFPIVGLAEMLLEDLPPKSLERENVREIYEAGRRGSELVKQILAFSRQSEQKLLPIHIQKILKEALKLCTATIPSDIAITSNVQQDCGSVMANPTQMHQVVMNLVTNAYHAIEPDSGAIRVDLQEVALAGAPWPGSTLDAGNYAVLSVGDTGRGIAPVDLGRIFEPYFTTKAQGKGTGLGLAVVYGIVKEHGGDVKVASAPGKGSTFEVYFPLLDRPSNEKDEKEAPGASPGGTERILVIDDEGTVAHLQRRMLESLGYRVSIRTDSLEGLNAFRREPDRFDLVVTDMTMPGMTGDRLASELLALRPDVPIIICTGFSERIDAEKAEAIGIKGFLMKPVAKGQLADTVRNVLDKGRG